MKVAYLIQCHKDSNLINKIIEKVSTENSDIYIHVDKRSNISGEILEASNIYLIENRFKVNWGSINQVYATIELLRHANVKKYDYVSLISGQDFVINEINNFVSFLEDNKGSEFIEYFELPIDKWRYEGGIGRIKYYWLNYLTPKRNLISRLLRNLHLLTIGKLFSKDITSLGKLYGGSQWFTITGELMFYICDFLNKNPDYLNLYDNSGCADEIFFQTLIMNSPFRNNVINDNLRFIKWEEGQNSPKILTIDDKEEILNSKKFFMRKVDSTFSKELISEFSKN